MMSDHIHDISIHDGRGKRRFYVDGKRVDDVFYADTKRGIVDHYRRPLKVDKHKKRVISERIRGKVEVMYFS